MLSFFVVTRTSKTHSHPVMGWCGGPPCLFLVSQTDTSPSVRGRPLDPMCVPRHHCRRSATQPEWPLHEDLMLQIPAMEIASTVTCRPASDGHPTPPTPARSSLQCSCRAPPSRKTCTSLVHRISWGAGYPFLTNGREEEVVDTVPSVVPRVARLQQLPSTHGETLECRRKVELRTRKTTIPREYHPGRTP